MKSDEGFLNNVDKQMLIQLVNENVTPITLKNLKKAAIWQPFFLNKINRPEISKSIHLLKF